jgi:hypothetical protein
MWKVLNAIYYPHNKLGKGYLAGLGRRGNNPNKDARRVQQARDTLESAKVKLEKAKILRERLNVTNNEAAIQRPFLPAIQQVTHEIFL